MWVPSFLWAKRKFPWNAEHIRIASVGSAPPQVRRQPGAQPLWWDWTPSCSFPCSCRACDWMFPKSCVPQSFNPWWQCKYHRWLPFIVNFNRKVSMLIDSGHGVQGSFWRFSPLWESPFSEVSDLAHFLMWTWTLGTSSTRTGTHEADPEGSPFWSCAQGSDISPRWLEPPLSNFSRFISPLLTFCFTAGILVSSCRISLFHSNNPQFDAAT